MIDDALPLFRQPSVYNRAMRGALFLSLLAASSFAQTAAPPTPSPAVPPDVDRALRARVTAFYDLLVHHQYRKAEEFVAPDTRDIYYERDKPRYLGFTLTSIAYSEEFTRASVVATIKMPATSSLIPVPMDTPVTSIWRLLDGAWYWSFPKVSVTDLLKSMNGSQPASPDVAAVAVPSPMPGNLTATPALPSNPNLPGGMGRPESMPMMGAGEQVIPQFRVDRASVTVQQASSEKVTITNGGSAPMDLFVLGKLAGVETTLDRTRINPGEKAVLTIRAAAGAKDGMLVIGAGDNQGMMTLPVTVK